MPGRPSSAARWDRRISRAHQLTRECPASADLLRFYAALAAFQKGLAEKAEAKRTPNPFFDAAIAAIPGFLAWLQHEPTAPTTLADAANGLRDVDREEWQQIVHDCTSSPTPNAQPPTPESVLFIAEAVLQPFAELAALSYAASLEDQVATGATPPRPAPEFVPGTATAETLDADALLDRSSSPTPQGPGSQPATCPRCGGRPILGLLREEGHGARRSLVCALCLTEREYLRLVCPNCGEQEFDALPVYTTDQFAHVRIDACDTCKHYVKTIDLTKNGLAEPVVDDIASVAMDLWARENGYVRSTPNLLRT
jgi:formate dehydrogenase maturation protein FdhE